MSSGCFALSNAVNIIRSFPACRTKPSRAQKSSEWLCSFAHLRVSDFPDTYRTLKPEKNKGLQNILCKPLFLLVRPDEFESPTPWFVVRDCQHNQLFYRSISVATVATVAPRYITVKD
jgi:hypothetical protein